MCKILHIVPDGFQGEYIMIKRSGFVFVSVALALVLFSGCGDGGSATTAKKDTVKELSESKRDKRNDAIVKKALWDILGKDTIKSIAFTPENEGAFVVRKEQIGTDYPHEILDYYDITDPSNPVKVRQVGDYFKHTHLLDVAAVGEGFVNIYEDNAYGPSFQRTYDYVHDKYIFSNFNDEYEEEGTIKGEINKDVTGKVMRMVFFANLNRMAVTIEHEDMFELCIYDTTNASKLYVLATDKEESITIKKEHAEDRLFYTVDGVERVFDLNHEEAFLHIKDMVDGDIVLMRASEDEKEMFVAYTKNNGHTTVVDYYDTQSPSNPVKIYEIGRYHDMGILKIDILENGFVNQYLSATDENSMLENEQVTWNYKEGVEVFNSIDVKNGTTRADSVEGLISDEIQDAGGKVVDMVYMQEAHRMVVISKSEDGQNVLAIYDTSDAKHTNKLTSLLKANDISDLRVREDDAKKVDYRVDGLLKTYTVL